MKTTRTKLTALALLCLILLTGVPNHAYSAAGDTDIGCYEYGYESPTGIENPHPVYPQNNYGGGGADYYVAVFGNDDTGDGSFENP